MRQTEHLKKNKSQDIITFKSVVGLFCPCFYEQYIKSRTGVSFDMELLWQQPSQFEPWPFAFSSILRSLQIGCLWLVVWQFWLFLLSSSAIITFLVDLIAAFLFALSSDVLLFCYFLLLKIFFKIPFLSFFYLTCHYSRSLISISRQENTMNEKEKTKWRNESKGDCSIRFSAHVQYIADIKRCDRDLVVLVPIHDFWLCFQRRINQCHLPF